MRRDIIKHIITFLLLIALAVPAAAENHDSIAVRTRMKELKYYKEKVAIEEISDGSLSRRIKSFQTYNNLPITGMLDKATEEKLFSDNALSEDAFFASYQEDPLLQPENTLFITSASNAEWTNVGEIARIRFQVKNTSPDRVVKAYEIQALPYDPWGDLMTLDGAALKVSTISNVKPGATQYSNRIDLERRQEVYALFVGISRVLYEDGTVISIPENEILYYVWDGPFLN